jgi:hypothetical protein
MVNNINNNKDIKEINDTQLEISANEQGLHLELEIPWKRLSAYHSSPRLADLCYPIS